MTFNNYVSRTLPLAVLSLTGDWAICYSYTITSLLQNSQIWSDVSQDLLRFLILFYLTGWPWSQDKLSSEMFWGSTALKSTHIQAATRGWPWIRISPPGIKTQAVSSFIVKEHACTHSNCFPGMPTGQWNRQPGPSLSSDTLAMCVSV